MSETQLELIPAPQRVPVVRLVWEFLDAGWIGTDAIEWRCSECGHEHGWRAEEAGQPACETCDPSGRRSDGWKAPA